MNLLPLINNIKTNWKNLLLSLYQENNDYFNELESFLNDELEKYEGLAEIFPPTELIFNAFNFTDIEDTKVIIIGQDPYHQKGQAMGLCFSVNEGIKLPPSLRNIYKEIGNEKVACKNGDLTSWASHGVLLLNTAFTVRESKPGSHSKMWRKFTFLLLKKMKETMTQNVIVLLWGNHAKSFIPYFNEKCTILEATHPSPLGSARGGWFGCNHFNKVNEILQEWEIELIHW